MADIHYFPRYSQKENMVTNNTLLLFNRLYQHHTYRFKQFINLILEDSDLEFDTTLKFSQQVKATGSIPDAVVEQESFKIVIETKLYGQQNLPQLMGHLTSFSNEDKQILLWINTDPISQMYREEIEIFIIGLTKLRFSLPLQHLKRFVRNSKKFLIHMKLK